MAALAGYRARMDPEETPQQIGVRFAEQVLGTTVRQGPPPPDSALGRILAYVEEHGEDALTAERFRDLCDGRPLSS
jgi:hypothetical protein